MTCDILMYSYLCTRLISTNTVARHSPIRPSWHIENATLIVYELADPKGAIIGVLVDSAPDLDSAIEK